MSPANAALSGGELTSLNLNNDVAPYDLYYMPDTELGHATVDVTPTAPIIEIAVTAPSAGWTGGRRDQTVKITNAGGTVLRGYYRLTATPDADSLFIEEVNIGDGGLITIAARTTPITSGDLCTILDRYDIFPIKPFVSDGTIYQDRSIAVGTYNATPFDVVNVTINSQPGHYGFYLTSGTTKAITAVVSVTRWPYSSGSTLTYAWTYPASFTGIGGATTATLTATAPVGRHWIRCTVTDSISGVVEIARAVMITNAANPPVRCNITRDMRHRDNGRTMTVRLVNARVSEIPAGALCVITGAQTWGGSDVASAAHSFAGYLYSQPYGQRPGHYETTADILSPAHILEMTNCYAAAFNYTGNTDTWEELPASVSTIPFAIWWVLRWRVANVLRCFNFTNPNTDGNLNRRRSVSIDPGKVWPQLTTLAGMVNLNVACRSDGEIILAYDPSYQQDRTAVITRATLTNAIYSTISIEWNRINSRTPVLLTGYVADLIGGQDIPISAEAPDELTGAKSFGNLVFESQADANQKVGRYYVHIKENAEYGRITLKIPANWDVIEPADMQRVTVTVPSNKSPTGVAISLICVPTQVQKTWIPGKRAETLVDLEVETDGTEGVTIVVPPADTSMYGQYSDPITDPISDVPGTWGDETTAVPTDNDKGLILMTLDGHVARGTNWGDMSPTDSQRTAAGTFIKMIADPYDYKSLICMADQGGLLTSDGTASSVTWRPISLAGGSGGATWVQIFNFATSEGGWDDFEAAYSGGSGWGSICFTGGGDAYVAAQISIAITPAITVTSIVVEFDTTAGTGIGSLNNFINYNTTTTPADFSTNTNRIKSAVAAGGAGQTLTFTGSQTGVENIGVSIGASYAIASGCPGGGGSCVIKKITVRGPGTNPFGGGSGGSGSATDEIFIADMTGSPNRQGYFAWLAKKTVGGTDYVYVNTTATTFVSRRSSIQIAKYVATMTYSLSLASFNSGATGIGFVSAGDPGGADCKVYKTTNWFTSVAAYASINDQGGAISVPYSAGGGSANAGSTPQVFYVKGMNTDLEDVALDGTTNDLHAGSTNYTVTRQAIQTYTLDGNKIFAVLDNGVFLSSADGGKTWTTKTAVPMTGSFVVGLNGAPNNPDFVVAYGDQTLAFTDDGGTTWTDLWSDYDTFRSGEYSSGGTIIMTAMIDLGFLYAKAVTS